jgi:hypothetical protein
MTDRSNRLGSRDTIRGIGFGLAITCLTAALAACGGGGDDDPATAAVSGNQAPTISGTPGAQAMQDQQYTFTPTASDANGDSLTFSIVGMPAGWTFNPTTGQLSGTPTSAQMGQTFSNIRISVSDGANTVNLTAFNVTVVAVASGSAMLSWNPPTQNTDGTPLSNLAGYRVYWGTSQGNYTNSATISAGLASYVVEQLTPATWYFALTAVNSAGAESAYSNVASKQVL